MLYYWDKVKGYLADTPNIDFQRCDGEVFSYDEVNTAQINNTSNSLTINGGQGNFPLAVIDTDKSLEFSFTSSDFSLEMFEMANAVKSNAGTYGTLETGRFEVATGLTVTIPYECQNVYVHGFEIATSAATGKITVAVTPSAAGTSGAAPTAGKTVITFASGDVAVGDNIRVSYQRKVIDAIRMNVKTNSTTAKGTLYAHYPIYSSGTDCTEAAIKGWVHVHVYRVRVTALPGLDTSYKTGATPGVTFAAMDPKRPDKRMWNLTVELADAEGNVKNAGTETAEYDALVGGTIAAAD